MNALRSIGRPNIFRSIKIQIERFRLFTVFTWMAGISFIPFLILFLHGNGQEFFIYARSGGHCIEVSHVRRNTSVLVIDKWPGRDQPASWYTGTIGVEGPTYGLIITPNPKVPAPPARGAPMLLYLSPDGTTPFETRLRNASLIPVPVNVSVWHANDWEVEGFSLILPLMWLLVSTGMAIKSLATLPQRVIARQRMLAGKCVECGYDLRAIPDRCPECGRRQS